MTLEIEMTRQDYLDYNIYHFLKNRLVSTIVNSLASLLVLQLFIHDKKTVSDMNQVIITSVLYLIIYFLSVYYSLYRSLKIPHENGVILGLKSYDFTDEGVAYADKNNRGQYNWSVVKSINESKKAFYLYVDTEVAIVIPKRYFSNELNKHEFVELVKKNIMVPEINNVNIE